MNAAHPPLKVGAVLFPGFELLDVFGPLEMFGILGRRAAIVMLAENPGPIPCLAGPAALAEVALTEAPELDVLLVPGGMGTRKEVENMPLLEVLHHIGQRTRIVASVCTGSALLARAGMLDGHRATSNKRAWPWVIMQGPKVKWVREARWVEDGKFFTSSGISAGTDMALALIARELGRDEALEVARHAEYFWHEDPDEDPFA